MVRSSKWLEGTNPRQPITKVARRALRERLDAVRYYARLAVKQCKEDIEYVHRLRVATRRGRAALQMFADLLPKREVRWLKKTLRGLRRAAGDARDLDVLGERLRKIADEQGGSQLGVVVELIAAQRRTAQRPLTTTYRKAKRKKFKKRSRALASAVCWRSVEPEPTFAEAARTTLVPLVDEFFAAAGADLSDVKAQHRMRIAGKKVRYAMELLAGAFDVSFRGDLYAAFQEVQEKLGTINDHATAIAMFNEWSERAEYNGSRDELQQLIASERQQLEAMRQEFRDWWTAARAAALTQHFARVLQIPTSPTTDASPDQKSKAEEARQDEAVVSARKKAVANV